MRPRESSSHADRQPHGKRAQSAAAPAPGRTNSELEREGRKIGSECGCEIRPTSSRLASDHDERASDHDERASERAQQLNGPTGCMKGGGKQGKKEARQWHAALNVASIDQTAQGPPSLLLGHTKDDGLALVNGTLYLSILTKSYASRPGNTNYATSAFFASWQQSLSAGNGIQSAAFMRTDSFRVSFRAL